MSFETRLAAMQEEKKKAAAERVRTDRETLDEPATSQITELTASRKRLAELRAELEKLYKVEGPDALKLNRKNLGPVQQFIEKYEDELKDLGVQHEENIVDSTGKIVGRRTDVSTADVMNKIPEDEQPDSVKQLRGSHGRVRTAATRLKEMKGIINEEVAYATLPEKPRTEQMGRNLPKTAPDAPDTARSLKEWNVAKIDSQIAGLDREIQRLELTTYGGQEKQLEAGKKRIEGRNKDRPAVATAEELDKAGSLVMPDDLKDGDALGDAVVIGEIKQGMVEQIDAEKRRRLDEEGLLDQQRDLDEILRFAEERRKTEEGFVRLKKTIGDASKDLDRLMKEYPRLRKAFEERFDTLHNAEEYLQRTIALEKSGGILTTTEALDREIKTLDLVSRDVKKWDRTVDGSRVFPGFADPVALRSVIDDANSYVEGLMHSIRAQPDTFNFTERQEGKTEPVPMQSFHERSASNLGRYGDVLNFSIDAGTDKLIHKKGFLFKPKELSDAKKAVAKSVKEYEDDATEAKGVVGHAVDRDWADARINAILAENPDIENRAAMAKQIEHDRLVAHDALRRIPNIEGAPPETRAIRISIHDNGKGSPLAFESLSALETELKEKQTEAQRLERDIAAPGKEKRGLLGRGKTNAESPEEMQGQLNRLTADIETLTKQVERTRRDTDDIKSVIEPLLTVDPIAERINEGDYTFEELVQKIRSVLEGMQQKRINPTEERQIANYVGWSAEATSSERRYNTARGIKPKKR